VPSGPIELRTEGPPAGEWATVALTLSGSSADSKTVEECLQEAREAGIRLMPGSTAAGTLVIDDKGDSFATADGAQRLPFHTATNNAKCRISLGKLAAIDAKVRTAKSEPEGCKSMGSVEGIDRGVAFVVLIPGNYDSAVVNAQVQALQRGGNFVVLDAVHQFGTDLMINGRVFTCP